ncbi:MAG: histidine--tRNA ligase [Finegoldia sp.]|nr:histidine--tRNA ligase [Finegoldia sp.]
MINPSTLAGMMELLPEDQIVFDNLKKRIENTFINNFFLPIDTPAIEKLDVLLSKGGGETSKQVYRIDNSKKDQGLRFDLTVPLAKYVAMYNQDLSFPFRRYQIGKVYRGERNQKGRYKEFYQCDIDIIGKDTLSLYNDSEVIKCMYDALSSLNIPDFQFQINNRKLLSGFLESLNITDSDTVLRTIDKIDKIGLESVKEELIKLGIDETSSDKVLSFIEIDGSNEQILSELEGLEINNDLFNEGLDEIKFVLDSLKAYKIGEESIKINLSITRGLDYYTGTVVETFLKDYKYIGSICSGGRYENLAENFSKSKYPGVGLSIGLTRLYYLLADLGLSADKKVMDGVLVIPMEGFEDEALNLVEKLRRDKIRSMAYLEKAKLKKKFSYADKLSVKYAIIIGEDEAKTKEYSLRDMVTGDQERLAYEKILEKLI